LLIISRRFSSQRGASGAEGVRIALSLKSLEKADVHLFALSPDIPGGDLESGKWNDITVHRMGVFEDFERTSMMACLAVRLLHRRHPFDALVGADPVYAGYMASLQGRLLNLPSLVMAGGAELERGLWRAEEMPYISGALRWAAATGCASGELADKCRKLFECENVFYTPPSVDTDVFCPAEKDSGLRLSLGLGKGRVIGFSGELGFGEGMHHWVEAAKVVSESNSSVKFLLVGGVKEEDRREYDSLLEAEPSLKSVIIETPRENDPRKMANHYRIMDYLFMPALWEGTLLPALESMACGTPVIASEVGGFKDIIEGSGNGFLFPPGDLEGAVDALKAGLGMPGDVRRSMSAKARQKVLARFTPQKEAQRIAEILDNITGVNSDQLHEA